MLLGFIVFYCFVCACVSTLFLLHSEVELLSIYITISLIKSANLFLTSVNYKFCCETPLTCVGCNLISTHCILLYFLNKYNLFWHV